MYNTIISGMVFGNHVSTLYGQASEWLVSSKKEGAHQFKIKIRTGRFQSRTNTHGTLSSVPAARTAHWSFILHAGTVSMSERGRPRRLR